MHSTRDTSRVLTRLFGSTPLELAFSSFPPHHHPATRPPPTLASLNASWMTTTPEQPGDANTDDGGPLTSSHQSRLDHGPDVDPATAPTPRRESPPSTQTPVLPDLPVLSDPKTTSDPTNAGSNEITDSEPDVLGPEDFHGMRARLEELGLIAKDPSSSTTSRSHLATESELATMVRSLSFFRHALTAKPRFYVS